MQAKPTLPQSEEARYISEQIKKRNEEINKNEKWILNPNKVSFKEKKHIIQWARETMYKHEKFFKPDLPNNYTIATGSIDHEEVDVAEIYKKFPKATINWRIFYRNKLFSIMLKADKKILLKFDYAKT